MTNARPAYKRPAPAPRNRIAKVLFITLGLIVAPTLGVVAIGLGLTVGVILAWIGRGLTKL